MKTRRNPRWFLLELAAVACLIVFFFSHEAATQPQTGAQKPDVKTAGGLTVVTFIVDPGTITVRLPDDVRAGDTISGTVVTEAKGNTPEEKGRNQKELDGHVLDLGGTRVQADRPRFVWTPNFPQPPTPVRYVIKIVEVLGRQMPTTESGAIITRGPKITQPEMTPSASVITPDPKITPNFIIPALGQSGRPIVITGPFDGDSSNTKLSFQPNPGETPGETDVIAESPRQAIFTAPTKVTGPLEITLTEAGKETKGPYRNVGVNLSAPKTNLLKGEQTTLRVEIDGLQGLKMPVPLTLESRGVITMEGGIYQPLVIQPSEVGADGRYSTTRGITGVQTGGWEATATVVTHRFDACLQDDTSGVSFVFDPKTGDYIFTQPGTAATKPVILPWIAQTRGALVPTSEGKSVNPAVKMRGCVITLEHNAPDRRIFAQLDTCAHTGNASVETSPPNSPKVKFTITDRNTRDNTCACGPGCN